MKKALLTTLLFAAALISRADLIWYENFAYTNGPIIVTGTNADGSTNWFRHSGSANPSDAMVKNGRLEVASTGGTVSRQDDVNRKLATVPDSPYTNNPIPVWASFTIDCTNLPTVTNYFALYLFNNTNFWGKVFALPGTLPSTWRLGISATSGSVNKIFPIDLAANIDYQVVVSWDPVTLWSATLWVNPVSESDVSVVSSDAVSAPLRAMAFGFRQASGAGNAFFAITNLSVATTFDEAATTVWSTAPVNPVIAYQPASRTNFLADGVNISTVAAGQSLATLSYQWRKNGVNISNPNGNSNVFNIASAAISDTGNYDVVVSTSFGNSVTSSVAWLWVTNAPIPPTITLQPTNQALYYGENATLYIGASGTSPTYQWFYNDTSIPNATDTSLMVADLEQNNGTLGIYRCDVSNAFGTTRSSNAVITATSPPAVKIGDLRKMVDPVFFLPTNTTALWTITGTVTTHTNVTTSANASFFVQDDTGGINVFVGGSTDIRPQAGDNVSVSGPLGQFSSLLEMNLSSANPAHKVITNSSGNPLPAGMVLPFNFTNSAAFGWASNAVIKYQGLYVTFTNVYFPDGFTPGAVFAGGANYNITNGHGETFVFRVDARVFDIIGQPIPQHAWTVSGPMSFFLGTTAPDRSAGFELEPTSYSEIVTDAPPAVEISATISAGKPTLTWTTQPYMSYSVFIASDINGPWAPLATGLTFNSTAGQFSDANTSAGTRFYQIQSP